MVKQCFEVNYFGYYRSMQVAAHRKTPTANRAHARLSNRAFV